MSQPSDPLGDLLGKPRTRRADVSKLFDALEKKEQPTTPLVTNELGMKLVLIPAGTFQMGSPADHWHGRGNEMPQHEVILTQPFYLGATVVTQGQYHAVMGQNPSYFQQKSGMSKDLPVEKVSWQDAVAFCQKLSRRPEEQQAGRTYRLPTEAEWEFACRAGTTGSFSSGDALTSREANLDGQHPAGSAELGPSLGKTIKVGSFPANNFGLFDMHGNVWEWCSDWYGESFFARSPTRDPQGPDAGQYRVVRGGSWRSHAATCRSAYRNALVPHNRDPYTGFRVACTVKG